MKRMTELTPTIFCFGHRYIAEFEGVVPVCILQYMVNRYERDEPWATLDYCNNSFPFETKSKVFKMLEKLVTMGMLESKISSKRLIYRVTKKGVDTVNEMRGHAIEAAARPVVNEEDKNQVANHPRCQHEFDSHWMDSGVLYEDLFAAFTTECVNMSVSAFCRFLRCKQEAEDSLARHREKKRHVIKL